ncbi:MAG: hypothetical protein M3R00_00125 [Pseudomonadota bacterium]|nr:hypothetical protein [Pseudomonadota bacterium]
MQKEDLTAQSGSQRFFMRAHYSKDRLTRPPVQKIRLPLKSKFAKRVPIEFFDQLLTDAQISDAPVFISLIDHTAKIYSFQGELVCELIGHKAEITAVKALSSTIIVSGDSSGELIIWDTASSASEIIGKNKNSVRTHNPIKRLHEHKEAITAIEAVNAETFISVSLDSSYKYWQTNAPVSIQTIVTQRPILSLIVLSPDDVHYCIAHDINELYAKDFHCYDIISCNRLELDHKIIDKKKHNRFGKFIKQVKLTPDGELAFLYQDEPSNLIIAYGAFEPVYGKTPARILANSRYAFWDGKENVVINLYPLESKPYKLI